MNRLSLKKIVSISVLLTFAFYSVSNKFPQLNFWKYSFVSFAVFLILYCLDFLYEKYLWDKHLIIRKLFTMIGFQEYPNIAGEWKIKYFSSYLYDWKGQKYKTKGIGKINIKKIKGGFQYSGNFSESYFKSSFNNFERNQNNKKEWSMGYKYFNTPKETNLSKTGFVSHSGFVILNFDEEHANQITGFYGTDENRKTRGKLLLTKK